MSSVNISRFNPNEELLCAQSKLNYFRQYGSYHVFISILDLDFQFPYFVQESKNGHQLNFYVLNFFLIILLVALSTTQYIDLFVCMSFNDPQATMQEL